jgi:Arc/MetJ-type ribon-helix-helix transcriptional regulator
MIGKSITPIGDRVTTVGDSMTVLLQTTRQNITDHYTREHSNGGFTQMSRKVISLSLPAELLDRVDEYSLTAGYASLSEYIRELIRNDLRKNANESDERLNWRAAGSKQRFTKPLERW